jgi:hypothetical protein
MDGLARRGGEGLVKVTLRLAHVAMRDAPAGGESSMEVEG